VDDQRSESVTAVLRAAEAEGVDPVERLFPLIYDDLRAMAHRQLRREMPGNTLSTTALVHEAYLKMVDRTQVLSRGRAYFFAAAARAMRQILIDSARSRQRLKRGGGAEPVRGDDVTLAVDSFAVELLALDDALGRFSALNPRAARVIEYRFFGGMSVEETAASLGVSPRTVKGDWALARAWLYRALRHDEEPEA